MRRLELDRREFIAGVASAAGTALIPAPSLAAATPVATAVTGPKLADWSIDDAFGLFPRYAEPIGYGRPCGAHGPAEPLDAL